MRFKDRFKDPHSAGLPADAEVRAFSDPRGADSSTALPTTGRGARPKWRSPNKQRRQEHHATSKTGEFRSRDESPISRRSHRRPVSPCFARRIVISPETTDRSRPPTNDHRDRAATVHETRRPEAALGRPPGGTPTLLSDIKSAEFLREESTLPSDVADFILERGEFATFIESSAEPRVASTGTDGDRPPRRRLPDCATQTKAVQTTDASINVHPGLRTPRHRL